MNPLDKLLIYPPTDVTLRVVVLSKDQPFVRQSENKGYRPRKRDTIIWAKGEMDLRIVLVKCSYPGQVRLNSPYHTWNLFLQPSL
jgi:hypothetical protein